VKKGAAKAGYAGAWKEGDCARHERRNMPEGLLATESNLYVEALC